jgi:thiamine-monophosphate kinase
MKNEFEWIRSISPGFHYHKEVITGIGDDAAVVREKAGYDTVLAVDTMVEDVHFTKETMPLKAIGRKALAVNVSDLAAMGAVPLYFIVSIAVPKSGWTQEEIGEIYSGMKGLAEKYPMDLIGGDTVSIKEKLVISVTVTGRVEKDRALLRSSAEPGDLLFLTGKIGYAAAGLDRLLKEGKQAWDDEDPFIQAHQSPDPHVKYGRGFVESGKRIAANDVSDGAAHESKEIAEASGVDVNIEWEKLPEVDRFAFLSDEKQEEWLLRGGEDFCLIGTASPKTCAELEERNLPLYIIGSVAEGKGRVWLERSGRRSELLGGGYTHF